MTDYEKHLQAFLSGDTSGLPEPNSLFEKCFQKALGIWDGELPKPKCDGDKLLIAFAEMGVGGGGGGDLPALTNPATAAQILLGYEAINQSGRKVTGTYALPDLGNPAAAALILATYEAIDQSGAKLTGTMQNNGAVSERLTRSDTSYTVPAGYHDGNGKVYIETQEKTVEPTSEAQEITPDTGKLLSKVIVEAAQGGGGEDFAITDTRYLFYSGARLDALEAIMKRIPNTKDCSYMFAECFTADALEAKKYEHFDVSGLNTAEATLMTGMFCNCRLLLDLDVSGFDTSNVTDMSQMFENCYKVLMLDVSQFNTSKVTKMASMFKGCTLVSDLDVTGFDTSNVTDMSYMFDGCNSLLSLDVSSFDTSKVTDMSFMFRSMDKVKRLDLRNFNTSLVQNMNYMFADNDALEEVDISSFDTSKVTKMEYWFAHDRALKRINMSNIDTTNVSSFRDSFSGCNSLEEIIGFSAMRSSTTISFPSGSTSSPAALKRLTFRTDLAEGQYAVRSAITLKYCSFEREGMVEMFNTLPDISGVSLSSSYKKITITGNPCITGTLADGTACDVLTDEDRAIATNKGWTLVE